MRQSELNAALKATLASPGVVPVMVVDGPDDGVPLAHALVAGGLKALEITLRTPGALKALAAISDAMPPGVLVGAGTVRTPDQAAEAMAAGARFLVSPGITPRLATAAERWPVPFLPGAATASEAMALADMGYRVLKLFPADVAGGPKAIKAFASPLADISFIPTGGVGSGNMADYLGASNVVAVGGSWICPPAKVQSVAWDDITELAREAATAAAVAR